MAGYGSPSAPQASPAILTGLYANPANRGKDPRTLQATLPRFSSWDEAIRSPQFTALSDVEKTNYLRSVYGLSSDYKVQGADIVHANPWYARYAPALAIGALVGGPALAGALGGAGGGAGAASAAGVTTGAVAPAPVSATAALAGAAVPGATGAAAGGSVAGLPWLDSILKYGVPLAGNVIGTTVQAGANRDASAIQTRLTEEALADARAQRDYEHARDTEQRDYSRQQYADYRGRLDPLVGPASTAATAASARMQSFAGGGTGTGPLIRLKAPNGVLRDVPTSVAEHYLSKGAVRV